MAGSKKWSDWKQVEEKWERSQKATQRRILAIPGARRDLDTLVRAGANVFPFSVTHCGCVPRQAGKFTSSLTYSSASPSSSSASLGLAPQAMARGLKLDRGRITRMWLPSGRILYNPDRP